MDAVVVGKRFGELDVEVRLRGGLEVVRVQRGFVPVKEPVNVGDRVEVELKLVPVITKISKRGD